MPKTKLKPPMAERRPVTETWHGYRKQDDFKWLKADNWQEVMHDPAKLPQDIRAYLEAENEYCAAQMADTKKLQEKLFKELKGRIKEDDSSVPVPDGPFIYSTSHKKGGQYPRFHRKPRSGGKKVTYFDGNKEAEGKAFFSLGGMSLSLDQSMLAWSVDEKGSEFYDTRFRDLKSGKDISDKLTNTAGGGVWSSDGQYFFYTLQDEHHRPLKTYVHKLGTAQRDDRLVYAEKDTGLFTSVSATRSEAYIIITVNDHDTSEQWLIDASRPQDPPFCVAPRQKGFEYALMHRGDQFIIKTNKDGAEDYKVMTTPVDRPSPENWVDLVPHRLGVFLVDVLVFKDWLVRLERQNALPRLVIRNMISGEEHEIAFQEEAYALGLGSMREFDSEILRFTYSSPTTPLRVYDYNMRTRKRKLLKTQRVPSGHDPNKYVARRLMAPAHDGEQIPVTLLYKRSTKLNGSAPLWLYGYGSYGLSMPVGFNSNVLSLVNRGFIYAIAHVRGGQEKGRRWYKTGKLEHKVNTFKDFISCGEFLAKQKFTRRGHIIAHGGSAGGLLMGAVANMAPDLFRGIVADVPFVDALTTMLDDTLPLTPPEWPEWGNPITDKKAYETIRAYAPYENVKAQNYPHIFALGGLTDPRVTYWEPAKWIAKLRTLNKSRNLLLLKINMGAGHGGASGRFDRLKEVAEVYAFGLKTMGRVNAR